MKEGLSLVIMAAGMGSRYGGLKQAEGFGLNGETLLEYSVRDAQAAGFTEFVFIIRREMESIMQEKVFSRLASIITPKIAYQDLERTPSPIPSISRTKPWGTAHAVWSAKEQVSHPFAVINADDFYGADAYLQLANFLKSNHSDYCMVAYPLEKTLSSAGAVSRGVCRMDEAHRLLEVTEHHDIEQRGDVIESDHGALAPSQLVSMNCWGLQKTVFDQIEKDWVAFAGTLTENGKEEMYLPSVVQEVLNQKICAVKVLPTSGEWFGVTYSAEKTEVEEKIRAIYGKNLH